jgi:hypothetical protein
MMKVQRKNVVMGKMGDEKEEDCGIMVQTG